VVVSDIVMVCGEVAVSVLVRACDWVTVTVIVVLGVGDRLLVTDFDRAWPDSEALAVASYEIVLVYDGVRVDVS